MSTAEFLLKDMEQLELYSRICYESYNDIWKKFLADYQSKNGDVTFSTELDFASVLESIILERNEYGKKYDVLIEEIDREGKVLLSKGAGIDIIKRLSNLIDEVIIKSRGLDIEVNVDSDAYDTYVADKLAATVFEVSPFSGYTKEWWMDKYWSVSSERKDILKKKAEREKEEKRRAEEKEKQEKQRLMEIEQQRNKEILNERKDAIVGKILAHYDEIEKYETLISTTKAEVINPHSNKKILKTKLRVKLNAMKRRLQRLNKKDLNFWQKQALQKLKQRVVLFLKVL